MEELDYELHLDRLTIEQIYDCIEEGSLSEQEVIDHYPLWRLLNNLKKEAEHEQSETAA